MFSSCSLQKSHAWVMQQWRKAYNCLFYSVPHIQIVTCLFRSMLPSSIILVSTSGTKMFPCYSISHHNNVIVIRKEKNCCKIVSLAQMRLLSILQKGPSFLLVLGQHFSTLLLCHTKMLKMLTGYRFYMCVATIPLAVADEGNTIALPLLPRLNHWRIS